MKKKIVQLLGGAVTTVMVAGSVLTPAGTVAAAPVSDSAQVQEAGQPPDSGGEEKEKQDSGGNSDKTALSEKEKADKDKTEEAGESGGEDETQTQEGKYDHIVNASHEAWKNYEWDLRNGSAEKHEIISSASEWLYVKAASNAGNSMSNRAIVYSKTAGDKIENGRVKMTFSPTCSSSDARMGIVFRCVEQGDCMYFAYDPSQGWYLQRKSGNASKKLLSSGVKTMAEAGEEITAEVEFQGDTINAWITYKGERIQCFTDEKTVATAGGSEVKAGKTGFMIGKLGNSEAAYIKSDVVLEDSDDSSTFNGAYNWASDEWLGLDAYTADCEKVERDAKNYYELQVDENLGVSEAAVVTQQQMSTDYPVKPFKTGKIDTYFTDLGKDGGNSNFAIVYRYEDINNCAWVGYDAAQGWYWQTRVDGKGNYKTAGDKIPAPAVGETAHVEVEFDGTDLKVSVDGQVISDGWYTTKGSSGETLEESLSQLGAGENGFLMRTGHVQVHDFVASSYDVDAGEDTIGIDPATLSTETMDVTIDRQFPRIQKYTFKDTEDKDVMWAQARGTNKIKINGAQTEVDVKTVKCEVDEKAAKAVYTIPVSVAGVEAVITAEISAEDNIASFDVTDIKTTEGTVETLEFPEMLMASVTNQDKDAQLAYAQIVNSTTKKGDYFVDIGRSFTQSSKEYKEYQGCYAFVSNDTFSAAIYSNSDQENYRRATATPGVAQLDGENAFTYMGLRSSAWEIEREGWNVSEDRYSDTEGKIEPEKPSVQVIITRDANDTEDVDWQDGAIALREIMYNAEGSEDVKDMVMIRIAENMASGAAHPFLESIDGIKRVALATDGLGQQLLLKGYASEGHDSAHPDYWNIGERMGGAEDLNKLLEVAHEYGTEVGIHINASEMYPDSKAFNDEKLWNTGFGWDWVDESYKMNTMYDLTSGSRADRLSKLRNELKENLDFIYLDVWSADTWQTDEVSKQFISNGWRCANEWGYANEKDATWTHWATDVDYGNSGEKGINSDIMRFIRNHQKDTWMANFPSYGGTMIYPLLGGENNVSFEGWQRAKNFDEYIGVMFNDNVPTKFLQHYQIVEWQNDESKSVENGNTEKYIRLESEDGKHTVEVERLDDGGRQMKLDGKKILEGHVNMNGGVLRASNETYLIPWYWDADGNDLTGDDRKLYHWNRAGGESTWELPSDWNVSSVKVYKLTDTGKTEEKDIAVSGGKITLTAEADTAYVVYPGEKAEKTYEDMEWGEYTGIEDPNFTSQTFTAWEVTGNEDKSAQIVKKDDNANPVLQIKDNEKEVSLSQPIEGLEAGKSYMLYGLVDNRSDRKAYLEVETADGVASNYAERSTVKTYDGPNVHNTDKTNSYMQNMPVIFTMPENDTEATLRIRVETGEGTVQYDELRVVEIDKETADQWTGDTFVQDFENVVQGWYPFVPGDNCGGGRDLTIHLSERNGKYTQAEWNGRYLDDVISGDWSLKAHHPSQHGTGGLVYQTIPQTYRFEKGVEYTVTFKYESATDNLYQFVVGKGEHTKNDDSSFQYKENIRATTGKAGEYETYTYTFTPDSDDWWIGINFNSEIAKNYTEGALKTSMGDTEGKTAYRMGIADMVIDDLTIAKEGSDVPAEADKTKLNAEILVSEEIEKNLDEYPDGAEKDAFAAALEAARKTAEDPKATEEEVESARKTLADAREALEAKLPTDPEEPEEADKSKLNEAIKAAEETDLTKYQDGAEKEAFVAALEAAKVVAADENASQEQVDAAAQKLSEAKAALKEKTEDDGKDDGQDDGKDDGQDDGKGDGKGSGKGTSGGSDNGKDQSGGSAVKTGDDAPIAVPAGLLILSLGAGGIAVFRRRKIR